MNVLSSRPAVGVLDASQVKVVRLGVRRRLLVDRLLLRGIQRQVHGTGHLLRDAGLHLEHVGQLRIVPVGPEVPVVRYPDELGRDPHLAAPVGRLLPAHAALQDVADSELLPDLPDTLGRSFIWIGAGAGDHAEVGDARPDGW